MLDITVADTFFATHLRHPRWLAAAAEERAAALTMAERDVTGELGGAEIDYTLNIAVAAVCEQAIWLLDSPDAQSSVAALLESESVEGIGSRTYRSGAGNGALSPRALRFIALLRGGAGTVPLRRG